MLRIGIILLEIFFLQFLKFVYPSDRTQRTICRFGYRQGGRVPAAGQARGPSTAAKQATVPNAAARVHSSFLKIEKNISKRIKPTGLTNRICDT